MASRRQRDGPGSARGSLGVKLFVSRKDALRGNELKIWSSTTDVETGEGIE